MAHVFHSMVKLYSGKFFGSLAKVVNLRRSRGNPKKMKEGLQQCHHDRGRDTRAQKLPPRPLTGRLGTVTNSENFVFVAFTQDGLVYVWEEKLVDFGLVVRDSMESCFHPDDFPHVEVAFGQARIPHTGPLACVLAHDLLLPCSLKCALFGNVHDYLTDLLHRECTLGAQRQRPRQEVCASSAESVLALQDFVRTSARPPIRSVSPVPPAATTSDHAPIRSVSPVPTAATTSDHAPIRSVSPGNCFALGPAPCENLTKQTTILQKTHHDMRGDLLATLLHLTEGLHRKHQKHNRTAVCELQPSTSASRSPVHHFSLAPSVSQPARRGSSPFTTRRAGLGVASTTRCADNS